jgi:hypothetical protein
VLEDDHVPLSLLVLHLGLERRAEGVQEVATGGDGGVGEETDPSESRDDALLLGGGGEDGEGGNASEEGPSTPRVSKGERKTMDGTHFSEESVAPRALAVTEFQVNPLVPAARYSTGDWLRNPSSTRVLMNAGNPWNRRVPRMRV